MYSIDTRHYLPRKGKNVTSTPVTVYIKQVCVLIVEGFLQRVSENHRQGEKSREKSDTRPDDFRLPGTRRHYYPPEAPTGRQR